MKLFVSPTSPYARKVLVLAHEVGVIDAIEVVATNPFEQDPALVAANPLSKVPTLVVSDELVIFDSRVICEYVDGLHDHTRFIPPAGQSRWRALRTQSLAEGVCDAAIGVRLESLRPEPQRSAETEARHLGAIRRSLAVLDTELPSLPAEPNIAHVSIGVALAYLDLRVGQLAWREEHEALARWFAAWSNRPSMVATAFPHKT